MTLAVSPTRFTPEDLLNLEKDGLCELVDGKLLEKPMSFLANRTVGIVIRGLGDFVERAGAGEVIPEQTFQCFPHDPGLIRRPDVAFIATKKLAAVPEEGHVPIAPDIAIEVISPNDKMYEFEEKLVDYRKAAIALVWEVNPKFRFIRVHRLDRASERLEESEILAAEPVLPGFSNLVRELLPSIDVGK